MSFKVGLEYRASSGIDTPRKPLLGYTIKDVPDVSPQMLVALVKGVPVVEKLPCVLGQFIDGQVKLEVLLHQLPPSVAWASGWAELQLSHHAR